MNSVFAFSMQATVEFPRLFAFCHVACMALDSFWDAGGFYPRCSFYCLSYFLQADMAETAVELCYGNGSATGRFIGLSTVDGFRGIFG